MGVQATIEESSSAVPVISDVTFAELLSDPYPTFKRARELAAVVRIAAANIIIATRYEDIMAMERDAETFSSVNPQSLVNRVMGHTMMRKDGEAHARERKAVEPALRPGAVKSCWAPKLDAIFDDVMAGFETNGEADLFTALAAPMAGRALADVLGFLDVDWQTMALWSQSLIDGAGNYSGDPEISRKATEAARGVEEAIDLALAYHRENPNMSVLSSMIHADDPHTLDQIYANIKVAVGGGLNEPRDSILTLVLGLLENPDQLERVKADPNLWPVAFEESVRWISPIGMYPRRVTRDVVLSGVQLRAGDQIGLCVGAANRDDSRFEDPDRFNVFREKKSHLAFGAGPHFCAGTWVARHMVGRLVVPRLFERLKNLRLRDRTDVRIQGWVFRGPTTLPVVWDF
ncbi:cytochrome P450 [Rhizobium sp. SRDI969]|uniref:cytochrome P450 n=1 Tax=Rhizobium sp. SRDI969 TaxID=3138252 RepID=UPI0021A7BD62|nr:cytochrome P450 [Rhizobium leguminosarum]UWM84856.1 cytochrome P450 [Rhizobium leguminosarum bv. viciae]